MGLLDELRRELERAVVEAQRANTPPVAGPPRPPQAPPPAARTNTRDTGKSTAVTKRIGGRLVRTPLARGEMAGSPVSQEATSADFQRKVRTLEASEAGALNALPGAAPAFDLGLPGAKDAGTPIGKLSFALPDLVRALILGGLLGPPKGRR